MLVLTQTIHSTLSAWYTRLWFALSASRCYQELDVRILLPGTERDFLFDKTRAALDLIHQYGPMRLRRMKRDLRGIWITYTAGNLAEYDPAGRLCLLDPAYLSRSDVTPVDVAATIIHEATHARLREAGFGYEAKSRARIENVCFRAEITFARHLPDGQEIVERACRNLILDPVVWTADSAEERVTTKLRELGVPQWLIQLIIRRKVVGKNGGNRN